MARDDIRVQGGAGGTVACIEEMEGLAVAVARVAERFADAESRVGAIHNWLDGHPLAPTEGNAPIAVAKARLRASVETLEGSPSSLTECHRRATDIRGALDEAIEEYERAEQAATQQMNLAELRELWGYDMRGIYSYSNLANYFYWRSRNVAEMMASLVNKADAIIANGGCLADALRRYHPLVREMLEQMGPLPLPGSPSTRAITTALGMVGGFVNAVTGNGMVKVTRKGTSTGRMTGGLVNLVNGVEDAIRVSESDAPSVLISQVIPARGGARSKSWVISIPPTTDIVGFGNPFDGVTDLQAMGAGMSDVEVGILRAMRDAGVQRGDNVLLVGYSLGGIAATSLASSAEYRRKYSPASVVTLGSPIASIPIPDDVNVLALEHRQDIFPAMGGTTNSHAPNVTTVTRDLALSSNKAELAAARQPAGTDAHNLSFYRTTLGLAEQMNDASVAAFKVAVAPILAGRSIVKTRQYAIKRTSPIRELLSQ